MRYLRYAFLAILAIVLVTVAMANSTPVTLRLLTDDVANIIGVRNTITLPMFIVIFGGIIAGVLIGFVWEWLREHKLRAEASVNRRDNARMKNELGRLKEKGGESKDEVLALLES